MDSKFKDWSWNNGQYHKWEEGVKFCINLFQTYEAEKDFGHLTINNEIIVSGKDLGASNREEGGKLLLEYLVLSENNKLIAEFRGMVETSIYNLYWTRKSKEGFGEGQIVELKFHSSWDWLMPVVVEITESEEFCNEYPDKGSFWEAYSSVDKNRIYEAVVKYIKWYKKTN